jgi:hypothetical protein
MTRKGKKVTEKNLQIIYENIPFRLPSNCEKGGAIQTILVYINISIEDLHQLGWFFSGKMGL